MRGGQCGAAQTDADSTCSAHPTVAAVERRKKTLGEIFGQFLYVNNFSVGPLRRSLRRLVKGHPRNLEGPKSLLGVTYKRTCEPILFGTFFNKYSVQ